MTRFDINATATAALQTMIDDGRLEQLVADRIEKTCESIIDDVLRDFSPFGESLKAAVEAHMQVDFERLGLDGYNKTVLGIVRQKLDHAVQTVGAARLAADMDDLLATTAPAEVTVSALVRQFIESVRDEEDEPEGEITAIVSESGAVRGYFSLYLDKVGGKQWHACEHRVSANAKGEIHSLKIGRGDTSTDLFVGKLHGFERTLFHLWAAKTRLVCDTTEPETGWSLY